MNFPWTQIRLQAISNLINKDVYYWVRYYRRKYCEYFFTPMSEVKKMDFREVFLNVFEFELEKLEDDKFLEYLQNQVMADINPVDEQKEEEELQKQIEQWLKEEEENKHKNQGFGLMKGAKKYMKKDHKQLEPLVKTYEVDESEMIEDD
jgi:hypothetical protein